MFYSAKKSLKLYKFRAVNSEGFCVQTRFFALNKIELKQNLQRENLRLVSARRVWFLRNSRLNSSEITDFLKEILTLMQAGIPLHTSMQILRRTYKKIAFQNMLIEMQKQLESGKSLFQVFEKFPKYFDPILRQMVFSGEQSGMLDSVFEHWIQYREKMQKLSKNIRKAMLYPAMVSLVATGMSIFLVFFLMPQFVSLFQNAGMQLPEFTQIVIQISGFFRQYFGYFFLILAISAVFLKVALPKNLKAQNIIDKTLLKLPFVGRFLKNSIFSRVFRTLAILLQAGIPILEGLKNISKICGNKPFEKVFSEIHAQINFGKTLSESFQIHAIFPENVPEMLRIGEESGTLEERLFQLAEYFEEKLEAMSQTLSAFLEPCLILLVCAIVGIFVVAMYLPIFHLGQAI